LTPNATAVTKKLIIRAAPILPEYSAKASLIPY